MSTKKKRKPRKWQENSDKIAAKHNNSMLHSICVTVGLLAACVSQQEMFFLQKCVVTFLPERTNKPELTF